MALYSNHETEQHIGALTREGITRQQAAGMMKATSEQLTKFILDGEAAMINLDGEKKQRAAALVSAARKEQQLRA